MDERSWSQVPHPGEQICRLPTQRPQLVILLGRRRARRARRARNLRHQDRQFPSTPSIERKKLTLSTKVAA